jgi:hypothetical protein
MGLQPGNSYEARFTNVNGEQGMCVHVCAIKNRISLVRLGEMCHLQNSRETGNWRFKRKDRSCLALVILF